MKRFFQRFLASMLMVLLLMQVTTAVAADQTIALAVEGKTDYRIVTPQKPTPVDDYAIAQLATYLKQITGATFEVISPDQVQIGSGYIYVGVSQPVTQALGSDILDKLKAQEHVSRSRDGQIYLYGKGVHGNLHAVFEFLENSAGWRWYSVSHLPVTPHQPTLTLSPFDRKRGFDFVSRQTGLRWGLDFYYQQGINQGYYAFAQNRAKRYGTTPDPRYVSYLASTNFVHTAFSYIPPSPSGKYSDEFAWQDKFNYFETNPEFFSMDQRGKRVADLQLCFSNPELRKELTRNIRRDIADAKSKVTFEEGIIITVDAADTPAGFCYCDNCKALEAKYQSPGGPLYDYLIELGDQLLASDPDVFIRTLAYRRAQTQKPPVLTGREMLPENLIIAFAPIEDNYFADWHHPDAAMQETFADLKAWSKITHHLWAWIYPNPWGSGALFPVGNVQRMVTQIRLMHEAGVRGLFADHNGYTSRTGWSELQAYLMFKLMQDVNVDTDALTREFLVHHYGPAADEVLTYLHELEDERLAMKTLPDKVTYASRQFDEATFPYLTPENMHRWQGYFESMLGKVKAGTPEHDNVLSLRRELDYATLNWWAKMQVLDTNAYTDYKPVLARLKAANRMQTPAGFKIAPLGEAQLQTIELQIKTAGQEKPLPEQFTGIPSTRIRTFVPVTARNRTVPREDADAPFGFAPRVDGLAVPFPLGAYSWLTTEAPRKGEHGPRLSIPGEEITPGQYKLYHLGIVDIKTPETIIWFGKSWQTSAQVGQALYRPGEDNRWDVYVSLKFNGPMFGGPSQEDEVLVGRIIMIDQSAD